MNNDNVVESIFNKQKLKSILKSEVKSLTLEQLGATLEGSSCNPFIKFPNGTAIDVKTLGYEVLPNFKTETNNEVTISLDELAQQIVTYDMYPPETNNEYAPELTALNFARFKINMKRMPHAKFYGGGNSGYFEQGILVSIIGDQYYNACGRNFPTCVISDMEWTEQNVSNPYETLLNASLDEVDESIAQELADVLTLVNGGSFIPNDQYQIRHYDQDGTAVTYILDTVNNCYITNAGNVTIIANA